MTIKTCKLNIVTKQNQHFESVGKIYSFGNKGNYGVPTVSQYVNKKSPNSSKQQKIDIKAKEFELLCSKQVERAITTLKSTFPKIDLSISPTIDATYQLQQTHSNVNFKETNTSSYGIWQCEVYINAATKIFHTEKHVTYTLISVPEQSKITKLNCRSP